MYDLAQETASYRERGISHKDQLARITDVLRKLTVEIEAIQTVEISDPNIRRELMKFRRAAIRIGRSVRRNPANILIEP